MCVSDQASGINILVPVQELRLTCLEKAKLGFEVLQKTQRKKQPLNNENSLVILREAPAGERQLAEENDPSSGTCRRRRRRKRSEIGVDPDSMDVEQIPKKYPRRTDEEIAQQVVAKIQDALGYNAKAPQYSYRQASESEYPNFPGETEEDVRLRIAKDLLSRGKDSTEAIGWANRFYSSCMRYVLRNRRETLRGKDPGKGRVKDPAATMAPIINSIANELCAPIPPDTLVHRCGNKVYAGLARANHSISEMHKVGQERRSKFVKMVADGLRGKLPDLPDEEPIYNPAAVISFLWNEPYERLCQELGLDNLIRFGKPTSIHRLYKTSTPAPSEADTRLYTYAIPFQSICPSRANSDADDGHNPAGGRSLICRERKSPGSDATQCIHPPADAAFGMEMVHWNQPQFPATSDTLKKRIMDTHLHNPEHYTKRRLKFGNDREESPSLKIYEIMYWPQKFGIVCDEAVNEMCILWDFNLQLGFEK
ncbi:hypothetical protein DL765_010740 [Monosporascus sp. GIB2]|nr:hypothetical protein DL765_010740 [Monosporascus sp. GIB2]